MNERRTDPAVMGYAGDVNPAEAYAELQADPLAVLVDVRTSAEWSYVGLPDLRQIGKRVIFIEWQRFPDGALNGSFVEQLRELGAREGASIYLLRRQGRDGCGSRAGIQHL